MSDVIRVIVVEREPLYRRGLVAVLDSFEGIDVAGSADTVDSGYRLADETSPMIALVGTTLTDSPGLAFAGEMRRRYPTMSTIVIAAHESDDELFAAIRAGAAAYTGRGLTEELLEDLVRRAAAGEYVINEQLLSKPYVAARVLDQFRNNVTSDAALSQAFMPLTERELGILRKVSEGMTNAEIGYALGISAQTVKNHVTSILRKLAVNDRTQAVVTALRRGWITIEEMPALDSASGGMTATPTSRLGTRKAH
jgi:DNA-binding NarL/FixJ family response regulator